MAKHAPSPDNIKGEKIKGGLLHSHKEENTHCGQSQHPVQMESDLSHSTAGMQGDTPQSTQWPLSSLTESPFLKHSHLWQPYSIKR